MPTQVWTALVALVDDDLPPNSCAETTHRLTRFFLDRHFAVSFHQPNLVIVSGEQDALLAALARLEQEPWCSNGSIQGARLCRGAWSPRRAS